MAYALGAKALKRLCVEQSPLLWYKAKLSLKLFKPHEHDLFKWVQQHVTQYHALPQVDTLHTQFPDLTAMETPEPVSYYVSLLENQFFYDRLNEANLASQQVLKEDQNAHGKALEILRVGMREITQQKFRRQIIDVAQDVPTLVFAAYHLAGLAEYVAAFGWPYLDQQSGGVMPGDVISFVGRPAVGKTWLTLWTALHNWIQRKLNVLYVSMEMTTLPISQRISALYAHLNIAQLKVGGYSNKTLMKFYSSMKALECEQAKMFVIDGNLAANVEDLYALSEMLNCRVMVIDGAYLLRHRNLQMDRYTRAAENVELIKRYCTDTDVMAFCSWQFNREASRKQKKGKGEHGDLEDIGYSDAIGQISSIVVSLFQEDSIETMTERKVKVLKGRNGEIGQFTIAWNFNTMSFDQTDPAPGAALGALEEKEPSGPVVYL